MSVCGGGRNIYKLTNLRVGNTSTNHRALVGVGDQKTPLDKVFRIIGQSDD